MKKKLNTEKPVPLHKRENKPKMQATWFSWDWKLSLIKHIWLLLGILLVLTIVIWVGPSPLATSSHESPVKVTPTQQVLGNNSMGMDTKEGPYGNIS